MGKGLLTAKARKIIREEAGMPLRDLASLDFNTARRRGVRYLYVERARGAVRPAGGLVHAPNDIERIREEVKNFHLPLKKTKGFRRILRLFR